MSALLNNVFSLQRPSLMGTAFRIVRDRQTAEDVTQEAYLRTRRAIDLGPIDHIEAFLHQTVRNLSLDHLRRRKTRAEIETAAPVESEVENVAADVPSLEHAMIERERFRKFQAALAGLPQRAQTVVRLSRVEEWSNARIAKHLGIAERTVFNDLKLAMSHCRDAMLRFDRP
ncbi:RNA polymerase sigma factor [Bradyrhizobium sp.]|uniref:RNA polymerase sigma factor n=1 Tax=Bradyrhizobium sp. TaxID=376 RepID=UPI0039E33034